VIADDHDLARAGLRAVFDDTRDLHVVAEAADGRAAVELCALHQPHLAVLDVRMPELDGLAAIQPIKRISPRTAILIVSFHATTEYVVEAVRLGAAGYLLKDSSREEILETARQVVGGEALLHGVKAAELLRRAADRAPQQQAGAASPALTPREREVLRHLTEGRTNREIATILNIKAGTVKNHVEHIIAKLPVSDRTQAAVYALRHGLIGEQET
jgi:DNA-binding NarL/FixJ family response regulator